MLGLTGKPFQTLILENLWSPIPLTKLSIPISGVQSPYQYGEGQPQYEGRTAATDYFNDGIHMNAVDTGWVTDEDPAALAALKRQKHDFQPPLDIVDGAARVCDPFFDGILTGKHWCGKFLKDYFPIDW